MKKITIFLASSKELVADRQAFETEIYRKCKLWYEKNIFLHLDIWEDLSGQMHKDGSQGAYNEKVKAADIFILLAHTKVGQYTAEEFEKAFGAFKANEKPFIFTYFKTHDDIENESLVSFQDKLKALNHFYNFYKDFNDLWNQFNKELERLQLSEFEEHSRTKKEEKGTTNIKIDKIEGTANFY